MKSTYDTEQGRHRQRDAVVKRILAVYAALDEKKTRYSAGFPCKCGEISRPVATVNNPKLGLIRRRRECKCGNTFTTYEVTRETLEKMIHNPHETTLSI